MAGPTRPLVRYHGGKWKLAPWIISHFPSHKVYVESFGGGASVLLRKSRSYAEVYNDLDGEMVNLFQVARDRGAELCRALELTPYAREEFFAAAAETEDKLEMARRTCVKAHMGFGSDGITQCSGFRGCATASRAPARDWQTLPSGVGAILERLRGVVVENKKAVDVIREYDSPDTLHYVDPPYPHSTRKRYRLHNYRHEMSDGDHEQLACVLKSVAGTVILSGYNCELYQELYADWATSWKETHADGAKDRTEYLWLNRVPQTLFEASA